MKREEEMRQLADTVIDVDAITLKRLILKLDNLEKALRELKRLQGGRIIPVPTKNIKIDDAKIRTPIPSPIPSPISVKPEPVIVVPVVEPIVFRPEPTVIVKPQPLFEKIPTPTIEEEEEEAIVMPKFSSKPHVLEEPEVAVLEGPRRDSTINPFTQLDS